MQSFLWSLELTWGAIQLQFRVSDSFSESSSELQLNWTNSENYPENDSQFGIWALQLKGTAQTTNLNMILKLSILEWFSESFWDFLWSIQLQFWEWFWNSESQLNCAPVFWGWSFGPGICEDIFCPIVYTVGWSWCLSSYFFNEKTDWINYCCRWGPHQVLNTTHIAFMLIIVLFMLINVCLFLNLTWFSLCFFLQFHFSGRLAINVYKNGNICGRRKSKADMER